MAIVALVTPTFSPDTVTVSSGDGNGFLYDSEKDSGGDGESDARGLTLQRRTGRVMVLNNTVSS